MPTPPVPRAASGNLVTAGRPDGPPSALFVPDGDRFVPTELGRGPWSPDALHGGPVAALCSRAVEHHAGADGLQMARLTLELHRPVPLAPLSLATATVRSGRRVQLVDCTVSAGGVLLASGRALRLRSDPAAAVPAVTVPEDPAPPPPGRGTVLVGPPGEEPAFHRGGIEVRFVEGRFDGPGPATAWFRLRGSVVAGEVPSPWERVAAAADFGNGISAEMAFGTGLFINPDLTVDVHRPPVGEWVCLRARTRFGSPGIGAAESELWDELGRIGRAVQTLVVEAPA